MSTQTFALDPMPKRTYTPRKRTCRAKPKGGEKQCGQPAMKGGFVCRLHGGKAPQTMRKAQERLADLIDPDRMLREAACIATSDLADFYDDDWKLKPLDQWTPKMRAVAKQVDPVVRDVTPGERGPAHMYHKLTLHDKSKNIELLFRHLGMLEKDKGQTTINVAVVDRLHSARARLSGDVESDEG